VLYKYSRKYRVMLIFKKDLCYINSLDGTVLHAVSVAQKNT